jgi:vacuolar-type H+-ATPase subunit E/Vma4
MTNIETALQRIEADIEAKLTADKRSALKAANAEAQKTLAARKMAASNKARRQMELLYPDVYKMLFDAAFELLGEDDRYRVA